MHETTTSATIINRGPDPEIAGTRITVYDVMDYLTDGGIATRSPGCFASVRDIQAAVDHIEEHRYRVEAE